MKEKLKDFFLPSVDDEVQNIIDADNVNNIYRLSFTVMIFELLTLVIFTASRKSFDRAAWISILSVALCVIICLAGTLLSRHIIKKGLPMHQAVTPFMIVYFILLSAWAVWVSYRHYQRGEQMLTFFAVELMLVSFVPVKPLLGVFLEGGVYVYLYYILFRADGAAGLNIFNYAILALISIVGMSVRYHSLLNAAEKAVQLKNSNEQLLFANRHDGLTGLRNRRALNEDVSSVVGRHVAAFMVDINYFKEINDTYGHNTGDSVLTEVARQLKTLFPGGICYRFGGDEFLVLNTVEDVYRMDRYEVSAPGVPDGQLVLSIGYAAGDPQDHDGLFALIAEADASLYEVKRKTHSPEFGGHDRRRPL